MSTEASRTAPTRASRRLLLPAGVIALVVGLVVTAAFALTSLVLYHDSENRLLALRAREVGSVLTAVIPSRQTPLASGAELADATGGSAAKFRTFIAPYVGTGRQPFVSASLWKLGTAEPGPVVTVGPAPLLASRPAQARAFFAHLERSSELDVTGLLNSRTPSLGYAFHTPGVPHGFAVYAETRVPPNRRSQLASNSAFSDLDYALYLGRTHSPQDLLVTSIRHFPISGRSKSVAVPFGDSALTLVVTPKGPLTGSFFHDLAWIIVVVGVVISVAAALMTDRLARRRARAEELSAVLDRVAAENHRLFTEQRSIAQTLQHALLPELLPQLDGLQVSARYVPAASGLDVGGDWYDVVPAGRGRVFLVIGDISGHGLPAATTMASLRFATLAYAAEQASPASVLGKLSDFVNRGDHDYFATVLCALVDVNGREVTMASAGHMAPLLIDDGNARYVELAGDVPIGVRREGDYREQTIPVNPRSTLVAFTDGLVERRGELLDAGLTRLREAAGGMHLPLGELLARLIEELASESHNDDTAIVGIRWQ